MTRPLVIAHRGASVERAEHTLAAYQRAIEIGADGLECDIRLTRDGHLVCVHDRRLERTSDGWGSLATKTLAELQRLDFGSWHGGTPARVLTLAELLELAGAAPRPIHLLIETKHPTRWGGLIERELIALLTRLGRPLDTQDGLITVMSFAGRALRRVHELAPALDTVFLSDRRLGRRRIAALQPPVLIAGPSVELLRADPRFVERAHRLGQRVFVWTVDAMADLEFVRSLGVDAVITNRPNVAIAAMSRPLVPPPESS